MGLLAEIVWLTTPAFSNSIFTLDSILPDEDQDQVIVGLVPRTQVSPPFGVVTVIPADCVTGEVIVK